MTDLSTSLFFTRSRVALACAGLVALAACGGGGGGGSGGGFGVPATGGGGRPTDTTPEPVTQAVTTKVIDGAIRNATVCLDKNTNGACDSGEPTAKTDATGKATLQVLPADVGKYPLVAIVGTDAVDADTGTVPVAFVLSTPADQTGVISPLTTVVQQIVADTGSTTAQAAASAASQTGLTVSLFSDFTTDTSAAGRTAASAARLIVVATQQQSQALTPLIGQNDLSGAPITQADVTKAIQRNIASVLTEIVDAALDPAVQTACSGGTGAAACGTALQTQASTIVAASGLSAANATVVIGAARTPEPPVDPAAPPVAGGNIDFLNFGDSSNWQYRAFVSTAAEATPDAAGNIRYRSIYRNLTAGALTEWGTGNSYARRDDTHWNGSAWVTCPLGFQMTQTQRDAKGRVANNNYCDGLEFSNSQRSTVDVSGKPMADIAAAIRASLPGYATWGDPPFGYTGTGRANYGAAVFPAGSRLFSQTTVRTATAPAYDITSPVIRYSSAITAGGDARANAGSACNSAEANANPTITTTTIEDLLANFKGTPCIFNQNAIPSTASTTPVLSFNPNEWWSNSTLSIGTIGNAPLVANPTAYTTGNKLVRLAFPGGDAVAYYSCNQRQVNGSSRNCTAIGTGTFKVDTLGDARVLTLTNAPALAASLTYDRVFVERGGKVYFGYKTKVYTSQSTRLNLPATNALFGQIGIPAIVP